VEDEKRLFVATISADGSVPSELRLFQRGVNDYHDGDRILFDEESANSMMERYRARGIELMSDYEHQSLVRPPIEAPASSKKWTPEVRSDGFYATDIKWTDRAKSMIAAGEYRYYSIAAKVNPKTQRAVEIINFALTNNPAANHIAPLKAASAVNNPEKKMAENELKPGNESVFVALGLKPDADVSIATATASEMLDMKQQLLSVTKSSNLSEALGKMHAFAAAHERYQRAEQMLIASETTQHEKEFDAMVRHGESVLKKLSPAMVKGEWIQSLRRSPKEGIVALKSFLESAPALVTNKVIIEDPDELANVELDPAVIEAAKRFVGDDPVTLKTRLDSIRAAKLEDIRARKAASR
jgi:phage I-like protein